MRVLVYGAGVTGSLLAAGLHQAGHRVDLLARGQRLADLRAHGLRLAEGDSPTVRQLPVPVVDKPTGDYDLIAVTVRPHQVDELLKPLADLRGDVLFLLNWAAGPAPLEAALGPGRVLLGFSVGGGTLDGDVVRHRSSRGAVRLVRLPIGEPDGRTTPRLQRIVRMLRDAGFPYRIEPKMDAWLRSHSAFGVPLGQAVLAAGGPQALSTDRKAVRAMLHDMRRELAATGGFAPIRTLPEALLVPLLQRFLRSTVAVNSGLSATGPAVHAEYRRLADQLHSR